MLNFPSAAREVDVSTLVWQALAKVTGELTPASFLDAVNSELTAQLATKETSYSFLTAISLDWHDIPHRLRVNGAEISFLEKSYPPRFKSREELLRSHKVPVQDTPGSYCRVIVKVKAKSTNAAVNKALRALDLQRALWCLMGNPRMQMTFGSSTTVPINVVRLGGQHTLHHPSGAPAVAAVWYEPGFAVTQVFRIKKPDVARRNSRWALRQIRASGFGEPLANSLVRFVRAFDERDSNTSFLRLWSALEALVSPERADYEKVVQHCSFLFKDGSFHRQMLEHLREYRNAHVHAGEESDRARTHCFQLQLYFVNLIWFYIRNAAYFRSLEEANRFLESPVEKAILDRQIQLTRKAIRFTK
jgi:hypothetical protein